MKHTLRIIIFLIIITVSSGQANLPGIKGPLVIQAHFTSPSQSISMETVSSLLTGKRVDARPFTGRAGAMRIMADVAIKEKLEKAYPQLKATYVNLDTAGIFTKHNMLLLSGLDQVRPHRKVLAIDNRYPWGEITDNHDMKPMDNYPLTLPGLPPFDKKQHITVVQTGVTAMTRTFIRALDRHKDLSRPLKNVKHILTGADLATTSNEVSFHDPCTYPLPDNMLFCTPWNYASILSEGGLDVIELTGNHNNDYGTGANTKSIQWMHKQGMTTFGGGLNQEEAEKVRYLTIKGTTISFVGFNHFGPRRAWATKKEPGAARLSRKLFVEKVSEAARNSQVVIVTVQWGNENNPVPRRIQKNYFRLAARLGATILVSSSSHRAMGLEFYRGKFISYGLGNFLFDQMQTRTHRRGLMARHHIYQGKHIQTEMIPYMIYNYSEPRLVHGREARIIMNEVYRYSLGPVFR